MEMFEGNKMDVFKKYETYMNSGDIIQESFDKITKLLPILNEISISKLMKYDISNNEDDFEMILNAESDIELQCLLDLSTNKESLSSEYHEQDMETLASSNYDAQIQFLYDVAISQESLNDKRHLDVMKLMLSVSDKEDSIDKLYNISLLAADYNALRYGDILESIKMIIKADTISRASNIFTLSINVTFLTSKHPIESLRLISNADSSLKAEYLRTVLNSSNLYSKYHDKDIDLVNRADSNLKMYALSEVAINNESLNSSHHEMDMHIIFNTDIEENLSNLASLACHRASLMTPGKIHTKDMIIMSLATNQKGLLKLAIDENSLKSSHHTNDMAMLSKADNDVKTNILFNMARSKESLNSSDHKEKMEAALNRKPNKVLQLVSATLFKQPV